MSTARSQLLPFDRLDDKQFESFLLQFLGAGISLGVLESLPAGGPAESELSEAPPPMRFTARHQIVRTTLV